MNEQKKLTPEQIKNVKGMGFLHNRGTGSFSGRVITENGVLTAKDMAVLSQAAEKFGNGKVTFTVRMTCELPGIEYDNIEPFREFLAKEGLQVGGTGPKVRPIVACKGTTCVYGLYDTQAMAKEIHKRFFEGYSKVMLPHKFKITSGGCPNNCAKPDLNDVGLVGQRIPKFKAEDCKGCKKCVVSEGCPMKAATLDDGKLSIDENICNSCGKCTRTCTFKIFEDNETLYKVYAGGKWGKQIRVGTPISKLFTKEEALDVVEKCILLFKKEGIKGERFGDTIDRIGKEKADELLISDILLNEKEEIINS